MKDENEVSPDYEEGYKVAKILFEEYGYDIGVSLGPSSEEFLQGFDDRMKEIERDRRQQQIKQDLDKGKDQSRDR